MLVFKKQATTTILAAIMAAAVVVTADPRLGSPGADNGNKPNKLNQDSHHGARKLEEGIGMVLSGFVSEVTEGLIGAPASPCTFGTIDTPGTWDAQLAAALGLGVGCNLASIHSQDELDQISALPLALGQKYWTGGIIDPTNTGNTPALPGKGNWNWVDASAWDFEPWATCGLIGDPQPNLNGADLRVYLDDSCEDWEFYDNVKTASYRAVYKCCV